jgi:AraC-like DNA-binding protein
MTKISYQPLQTPCVMKRYFYQLISRLCEHYHKKELISERFEIISEGIQYLEENEKLSLSIAEIANLCNVSEVYFRKLFKEYSGVTPHQFKINAKIRLAKQHLLSDNMTISETASDLGFNEVSYFCEIFKQKTGYTPTEYINKMKKR